MHHQPRILIVDDEIGVPGSQSQLAVSKALGAIDAKGNELDDFPYELHFCTGAAPGEGHSLEFVLDEVRKGWTPTENRVWALVLLDIVFGSDVTFGLRALTAIRESRDLGEDVPVVMLTREAQQHQSALRRATGFLPKVVEGRWSFTREILDQKIFERGLLPDQRPEGRLIGGALALLKTLREIRQAIRHGAIPQACLLGERGVGKTQLARYAHDISRGRAAPFQVTLAQAENVQLQLPAMFGAWPHAHTEAGPVGHPGSFELAHEGTLFLDEVANLPPDGQKRLLEARAGADGRRRAISRYGTPPLNNTALLERCLREVGGEFNPQTGQITVEVSLITASNAELDDRAERERLGFRADLWDGLLPAIRVPNLNERRSDIRPLFEHLMAQRFGCESVNVDKEVIEILDQVDWSARGNIRGGLQQIVNDPRMRYDEFGVVTVSQLPPELLKNASQQMPRPSVEAARADEPEAALDESTTSQSARGSLGATLVARYRQDLELLAEALRQTQDTHDAKPSPARALKRLLNRSFPGAEIDRTIKKLFFKPVFEPSQSLERCLLDHGLTELQHWARSQPLLQKYAQGSAKRAAKEKSSSSHH